MRLTIILIVLVTAGAILIWRLATYDPLAGERLTDLSDLASWEPTTDQIKAQLASAQSLQSRQQTYSRLLRSRYRDRNMPVNLRAGEDDVYYLECGATIPTWDKSLIAWHTWKEVRELFGGSPHVLIYESYIGTPSRRVGVAKPDERDPSAPRVVFDTGWHLRRKPQKTDFLTTLPRRS